MSRSIVKGFPDRDKSLWKSTRVLLMALVELTWMRSQSLQPKQQEINKETTTQRNRRYRLLQTNRTRDTIKSVKIKPRERLIIHWYCYIYCRFNNIYWHFINIYCSLISCYTINLPATCWAHAERKLVITKILCRGNNASKVALSSIEF